MILNIKPYFKKVNLLLPDVKKAALLFLEDLENQGINFVVFETLRTKETQIAYFAQGRTSLWEVNIHRNKAGLQPITEKENGSIITKTLLSSHIEGRALDVVYADEKGNPVWNVSKEKWIVLGDTGKKYGFVWGGDWGKTMSNLGWDCPHFEIKAK